MQCAKRINNERYYPVSEERKITPKCNEQSVSNRWENIKVGNILRKRLPEGKEEGDRNTQDRHHQKFLRFGGTHEQPQTQEAQSDSSSP